MSRLFIVGNGFDIDLGLSTRYSNFANCDQLWPFKSGSTGLAGYLISKKDTEKWLDIEQCLLEYAASKGGAISSGQIRNNSLEDDKRSFEKLTEKLCLYIQAVAVRQKIKKDSVAAKVLKAISENGEYKVYTFNYTDINDFAVKIGAPKMECVHVHGSVEDKSIILGIDAKNDVIEGYDFLYKVYDPFYQSNTLRHDLEEAEEVVIFGHSLGPVDYSYFRTFFRNLCREENSAKDRKKVTVFTYDDESRLEILRQLRIMNNKEMQLMFNNNDFQIICTDYCDWRDKDRFDKFLKHLQETKPVFLGSAFE